MVEKQENKINRTKFNIIVLGEGSVGKSSIISRLKGKDFEENNLSTVGIDYYVDEKVFDNTKYKFKIFDTAGQERYKSIASSTIKLADGFLIVFAVDNKNSFEKVKYWFDKINEETNLEKKRLFLVGNKIDLQRIISNEDGVKYAKEKKMKYYEVSAKTGFNIKEIFDELYKDVYILKKENDNFLLRRMTQEKTKKKKKFC